MIKPPNAGCIDAHGIGQLLAEFQSGALDQPEREMDRQRFYCHAEQCPVCYHGMLDHVNESITVPFLRQEAARLGIPLKKLIEELGKHVETLSSRS